MAEIKIPIGGVDISVPAWSTEETLTKLVNILSKNGSTGSSKLDKAITKIAGTGPGDKKSLAGAIGGIAQASDQLGKSGKVADVAFTAASTAITSVSGVVSTLATSKGNFQDLNPLIDATAEAFGGLVSGIPIVGGLLKGLGDSAAAIAKLNNAIADELVGGIDQLTVQGFSLARDFNKVGAEATTAGIGFITFADIASKNAQALAALGGTFDKGAKRFLNITEMLAKEDEPLAMGMRAFGFSAEATAEFLADFIDSQVGANLVRTMSDQQVAKAAFEVAKQQRIVAELTGTQADDLKRQQDMVREEQSFQAMLQKMRNAGETQQAKAIEQFIGSLPTKEAQMLAMQMLRTNGAAASQETALLDLATDGKLGNSIMAGFDTIFAAGEEGALSSVALATAGTVEAIASVANNSAMLETASLGLLGSGNAFSTSIGNILQSSRRYKDIIDQNGGDARALAEQLMEDAENIAEGNREGISQGNEDILMAQKGLEQAAINMENVVMQNLGPALMAQVFVINKAVGMINKVLRRLGGDGSETEREVRTFEDITSGEGSIAGDLEEVIIGRKAAAGGSFMGSGEAQMKNYGDQIQSLVDEVGGRNVEAAAIGGASAEDLRVMQENFKMFDREFNDDGTVKKVSPMEDVTTEIKQTNSLIEEMIRKQKQQITATEDLSGSGTY